MFRYFILISLSSFFLFACNSDSKESGENTEESDPLSEIELPQDRELNPYEFDAEAAVNPSNLNAEVIAWANDWTERTVQVIGWLWGGVNNNNGVKSFTDPNNPGLVVLKADLPDSETEKIADFAGAEYVIIEGVTRMDGATLHLMNASIVGPYQGDSLPIGQNILPKETETGLAFNPLDIESAIDAWMGVTVTVEGVATLPLSGNVITFKADDGTELVSCVTAQSFDQESTKPQHVILKGVINGIDEVTGVVSLGSCERLN